MNLSFLYHYCGKIFRVKLASNSRSIAAHKERLYNNLISGREKLVYFVVERSGYWCVFDSDGGYWMFKRDSEFKSILEIHQYLLDTICYNFPEGSGFVIKDNNGFCIGRPNSDEKSIILWCYSNAIKYLRAGKPNFRRIDLAKKLRGI